ncbi:MAG: flagellar biosynthetic protein FliO [Pseudomonadota bacterium]
MNRAMLSVALLLGHGGAWAAQSADVLPPALNNVSPLAGMLQVMLGLVLVLAALAATVWLLRRFAPGAAGAGGAVRIIGGVMVGPKEKVILVEVGDTWLLLGVGGGQVNALHSMPKPENAEALTVAGVPPTGFAEWIRDAMQRRKNG